MDTTEWNRLLDLYSIEDGNNFNTGSRLTMKPLAGPLPRRMKSIARELQTIPAPATPYFAATATIAADLREVVQGGGSITVTSKKSAAPKAQLAKQRKQVANHGQ